MPLVLTILGATGKMGQCVQRLALHDPDVTLIAATTHPRSSWVGKDLGDLLQSPPLNITLSSHVEQAMSLCDVAIDFSNGSATAGNLAACRAAHRAFLETLGRTKRPAKELALSLGDVDADVLYQSRRKELAEEAAQSSGGRQGRAARGVRPIAFSAPAA